MRWRMLFGITVIGLLTILTSPPGFGQFKGGGFPGGGFGGPPGGGFGGPPGMAQVDPGKMFDFMAKGRPFFMINETKRLAGPLMEYAQQKGITDGKITREQFVGFSEFMKAKVASGAPTGMPPPKTMTLPGGGGPGPFGSFMPPGANNTEMLNQWADADFRRHDENGDGKLNVDEMPGPLRKDLAKWDTNGDGFIDQTEYRHYFITRFQERMNGGGPGGRAPDPVASLIEEDLDKRPVVYRAGKLPEKGLPPWFKQLDTDNDGQVALYEWRLAGKDLAEFKQWDRDDDGFITPEEALQVQAKLNPAGAKGGAAVAAGPQFKGPPGGGPPQFNGPPGGGGPPQFNGPPGGNWSGKKWQKGG
jgi:hypothetical protein